MNVFSMKRPFIYLFLIVFAHSTVFSQTEVARSSPSDGSGLDPIQPRADIIPHSPEVEAMAKYGVLPVTQYTGMPQITVPIFDIKASGLTIPFALSYNYNGFKPMESASWCGLGWSVQGGGSIAKIIKGQPDGTRNTGNNYDDFINASGLLWSQPFLANVALGQIDAEPDIYIFNVAGYSGKFILIKGEAYLFPFQNVKISVLGNGFKMIDDKGNIFLFNDTETTFTKNAEIPVHISSWQISKIITADKKDTIEYYYNDYSFKQPSTITDRYNIDSRSPNTSYSPENFGRMYTEGDHIDAKVLTAVVSRYGNISFVGSSSDRLDLPGSVGAKELDKIIVTGPIGSTFRKEIVLLNDYFGGDSKLKLNETFEQRYDNAGEGDISTPVIDQHYLFEYNNENANLNTANLADAIDYWGYYNGVHNAILFPSEIYNWSTGNRNANISYGSYGTLNKITYPTGGYSTFQYEQNKSGYISISSTYSDQTIDTRVSYDPNLQQNGVTRIGKPFTINKAQTVSLDYGDYDEDDAPSIPVVSIYKNNMTGQPIYSSPIYPATGMNNLTDSFFLNEGNYVFAVSCQEGIVSGEVDFATYGILHYKVYDQVNTLKDGPGLRVKKIQSYAGDSAPALIKQYTYNYGVESATSGITGSNLYHTCADYYDYSLFASVRSSVSDLAENQFYYKNVTETSQDETQTGKTVYTFDTHSNQLWDVKLQSQTDYKLVGADYVPVKSTANQYQVITKNSFVGFGVSKVKTVLPVGPNVDYCILLPSPDETQPSLLNDEFGVPDAPYVLISDYTLISDTKEISYKDDGTIALMNESNYYYDNTEHIFPTRIVTQSSNGEQITQELKYPLDYTLNNCNLPGAINDNFNSDVQFAMNVTLNNSRNTLINALAPYQPYEKKIIVDSNGDTVDITVSNRQAFTSIANQYNHCQADFQNDISTAISNRNNALDLCSTCLNSFITNNTGWQQAIAWMQLNNVVSPVVEKYTSVKRLDGNEYLLSATRNEYQIFNSKAVEPVLIKQTEVSGDLLKTTFAADQDTYYKPQLTFSYDKDLNLSSQQKRNDIPVTYLYGYYQMYPIAEIKNASFVQVLAALGLTEDQYHTESLAASPSSNYISKLNSLRQNLTTSIITFYTYDPLIGITSVSDANSIITHYQYDVSNRLKFIKDNNEDILQKYDYHFKEQE